jgi:hypothetical protein
VKDYTYIAIQQGGYFGQACIRAGYMKADESCVIEFRQFTKFMNEGEITRPLFISTFYGVCVDVARKLNQSAFEIQNGVSA